MKTSLKTLILLVFAIQSLCAQEKWKNFTNKDRVNAIAIEGNKVWIGTTGGVVLRDTSGKLLAEYTKIEGLANNDISSIVIDAQNNKWFGTYGGGVSKFDGSTWTTYNTFNSGLAGNDVLCIVIDAQSNKWFGTSSEGISKFDDSTWTTYDNSNLINNWIRSIAIDATGSKWVGTNEGLFKFDDSNQVTKLLRHPINAIAIDAEGNKWLGTGSGAYKFYDSTLTNFNEDNYGLTRGWISSIAIDTKGIKWMGDSGHGLYKFDDSTLTYYCVNNSGLVNDVVTSIAIDAQGNKWFGTYQGVSKFDGSNWNTYKSSESDLFDNDVRSIAIDAQDNKWVGIYDGAGVSKFDGVTWTNYNSNNSEFKGGLVTSIAIDSQSNKWVGAGALHKFNDSTWTIYFSDFSTVTSIAVDVKGNKWIGTISGGVYKFDDSTWTHYNTANSGLVYNYISSIAIDAKGNKWIGTISGGVYKFDDSTWTPYNTANSGLAGNEVTSIAIDMQGNKWFGTGYGVSKFDDSTWFTYNSINSALVNSVVHAIAIDEQGNKWFGTWDGVYKFDDSIWTKYNSFNSGITGNFITSIVIDALGNKWFGSNRGISVLLEDNPFTYTYSKTISGKVFLDKNKNSIKDTNEHYLSNQKVSLSQGKQIAYTNTQGIYTLEADTGKTYRLSYVPAGNYKLSKDTSFTFRLGSNPINLPDFAVYAPDTTVYKSNIVTLSGRCSQETTMWLTYNNFGTTKDNTKIEIQLDKDVIVKSSFPAYDSLKNNKMYFTLANFQAGTDRQIKLNVQNPDFTRSGDTLLYTSKLIANGKVFADTLKRRVTCAYDPNIKEVSPAPIGAKNYTLKNKPLNYTVHFQNTGNDTAYHVLIKDTISKFLDYNSLQITGSSHSLSTTLDSTSGLTQFMFFNIMLADSNTNEKASHGFVSYTIKPKANLPEETMIKNTAYIYFDYNPAVVTNTTLNNLVTTIPNGKVTAIEDHLFAPKSIIIPHPLSSRSAIQFKNNSSNLATLQVLDLTGQSVLSKTTTESEFLLNRNEFNSAGLYIYQIKVGDDVITGKLLVE